MHVPTDRTLETWIRELMAKDRLYLFYKTPEWLQLKNQVMRDHNWECEDCAELGRYSHAQTVHHEFEVKKHPDMALKRYVRGNDGELREILHPLCNQCHNKAHGRTFKGSYHQPNYMNEERW